MGGPARQRTATQPAAGFLRIRRRERLRQRRGGLEAGSRKTSHFSDLRRSMRRLPLYGAKRRTRRRNAAECDVLHDFLRTCPSMLAVAVTRAASKLTPARASSEA